MQNNRWVKETQLHILSTTSEVYKKSLQTGHGVHTYLYQGGRRSAVQSQPQLLRKLEGYIKTKMVAEHCGSQL